MGIKPTPEEFRYIDFIDTWWHEHKRFPSAVISSKKLDYTQAKILELNKAPAVIEMLSRRGIEVEAEEKGLLTEEQIAAANTYLNIADQRPLNQKLKELGISPLKFNGWMRGAYFGRYMRERAEELFEDGMPFAHRELMAQVMHGNLKAIKLFYEVSGRYTGIQSVEQQNISLMMQRLLEAIQMEVADPLVIQRIGERFQSIASGEANALPQPVAAPKTGSIVKTYLENVLEKDTNRIDPPVGKFDGLEDLSGPLSI